MKNRLSDWSDIAQIVSGVAVVITLIFLVVGINKNTEIARATAYDSQIDSLNEIRKSLIQDPDLMLAWQAYRQGTIEDLNELDRIRLEYQVNILWASYEKAFYAFNYGIIGAPEWTRFERLICDNVGRLKASGLDEAVRPQLTAKFLGYVEDVCVE
jgi:hypothetical protein